MIDGASFHVIWAVVGEYDRYLREGEEFDRDIVGFEYWRRTARRGW
jgi:hypothetical protein